MDQVDVIHSATGRITQVPARTVPVVVQAGWVPISPDHHPAEFEPIGVAETAAYPKSVGGGMFELSNGERVRGKQAAAEAEDALADTADES